MKVMMAHAFRFLLFLPLMAVGCSTPSQYVESPVPKQQVFRVYDADFSTTWGAVAAVLGGYPIASHSTEDGHGRIVTGYVYGFTPILLRREHLSRAFVIKRETLGIHVAELEEDMFYVIRITPDSPAATAGIQAMDVIDQVNGQTVMIVQQVEDAIATGNPVDLVIWRWGEVHEFQIKPRMMKISDKWYPWETRYWLEVNLKSIGHDATQVEIINIEYADFGFQSTETEQRYRRIDTATVRENYLLDLIAVELGE